MTDPEWDLAEALRAIDALAGERVVVLGDVMLDRYWWGTVSRLSPEAPVPVVHKQRSTVAPGGAANVAANIASLGGAPRLVGVVGDDEAARELVAALAERGIATDHLFTDSDRPTTVKTRIVAHHQHVVRVDEEHRGPIPPSLAATIVEHTLALLEEAHVLVVSDYAKGLLAPAVLRQVIGPARTRGMRVVVDPKGTDWTCYGGAALLCPNRGEAFLAAGLGGDETDAVERAGLRLLDRLAVDAVLITLGEAGMALFERYRPPLHVPALARQVYDVTGAGDTVVATLALALTTGAPLPLAVRLANAAAGLAVEQVGTAAVTAVDLLGVLGRSPSARELGPANAVTKRVPGRGAGCR